jgi:hypothetical protein
MSAPARTDGPRHRLPPWHRPHWSSSGYDHQPPGTLERKDDGQHTQIGDSEQRKRDMVCKTGAGLAEEPVHACPPASACGVGNLCNNNFLCPSDAAAPPRRGAISDLIISVLLAIPTYQNLPAFLGLRIPKSGPERENHSTSAGVIASLCLRDRRWCISSAPSRSGWSRS